MFVLRRSLVRSPLLGRALAGTGVRRTFADEKKDYERNESFGFKKVRSEERQNLVNSVFSNVASAYDVMNDFMSFGVHRLWKVVGTNQDYFVTEIGALRPKRIIENGKVVMHETVKCIDVAGGTGDIAFKILKNQRRFNADLRDLKVTVYDINSEMLKVGQQNAVSKGYNLDNLE